MAKGHLSNYFDGVASKRLSAVEADDTRSNQHEFHGDAPLKGILGTDRREFACQFIYLADDEEDSAFASGAVTWYDARKKQSDRSPEYRLYFPTTPVSERAAEGDLLVVGRRSDDTLTVLIARAGSTAEHQIRWLFDLGKPSGEFAARPIENGADPEISFASRLILGQLGIEAETESVDVFLGQMLHRFRGTFPKTAVFSAFARDTLPHVRSADGPDAALVQWMDREEALFLTLESHFVSERLKEGFADVATFIAYSLSVQNRRKARAGYALEHHMEQIFREQNVKFKRNGKTENNSEPDFLFPGEVQYADAEFSSTLLTMLGVKSTCKDRWRQVLAEANRISRKHLLTLEPGISLRQTDQMEANNLQLVLPRSIHSSYSPTQQQWLWAVEDFIGFIQARESVSP
jgi:hypothetical protein